MSSRLVLPAGAYRWLPEIGVWRVARDVYESPALPSAEGPVHRFDDPAQRYSVRYMGQDIETCLLETMQRFRPSAEDELARRLAAVTGVDPGAHRPDEGRGLVDWLAKQRVGLLVAHESEVAMIDLPTAFDAVMGDPTVSGVFRRNYPEAKHPDMSHVLAGDSQGRSVTQAISAAIHSLDPLPGGITYPSRRDTNKTCWAVFIHVSIWPAIDVPLSADEPDHVAAVREVCARYGIPAPATW